MDPISSIYQQLIILAASLPPAVFLSLVRMALLLSVPYCLCVYSFRAGSRSVARQVGSLAAGILLAFLIPINVLTEVAPVPKLWILVASVLGLVSLPRSLSFYITPVYQHQIVLEKALYALLVLSLFLFI